MLFIKMKEVEEIKESLCQQCKLIIKRGITYILVNVTQIDLKLYNVCDID